MKKNNINEERELQKKYAEFEAEIIPFMAALKSFALKMTNDQEDAEDLVQDTMLKAFRFFDKFEKGTNAKAWLFQIMKNSYINNYRRNVKEPNKVDYDDIQNFYENIKSEDVKTNHFQGDAFSDILTDEVADALSKLPDDFRTIVFLSDIEGYTYEEIADFIDRPIGTVRSRLHRARKMLYALLLEYATENGFSNQKKHKISSRSDKSLKEIEFSYN